VEWSDNYTVDEVVVAQGIDHGAACHLVRRGSVASFASAHGGRTVPLSVIQWRSVQLTPTPDIGAVALLIQQVQDEQHQGESSADRQRRPIPEIGDPCGQHSQAGPG
jgi:hypothetical protein